MVTIGIDPGFGGALACLVQDGEVVFPYDMPIGEVNGKRHLSITSVLDTLTSWRESYGACACALEAVLAMPGEGVTSSFRFGEGYGALQACVIAAGHKIYRVRPSEWKRALRVPKGKGAALLMAQETWPDQASLFSRKKDDGRAEAALLALWILRQSTGGMP
jgi:hypothetical protein